MSTFKGSETSGALVLIYTQGAERIPFSTPTSSQQETREQADATTAEETFTPPQPVEGPQILRLDSRRSAIEDDELRLLSVSTTKSVGGAPGQFTVAFKSRSGRDFTDIIVDDDWVDISFTRHSDEFHVMRGLIDTVTRRHVVGANGATEDVYIVSGRDFTKIFVQTPIWFDRITDHDYIGAAATRIIEAHDAMLGQPNKTVGAILNGFLSAQSQYGRSCWTIPPSMGLAPGGRATLSTMIFGSTRGTNVQVLEPTLTPDGFRNLPKNRRIISGAEDGTTDTFTDQVLYFTDHFYNNPSRSAAINPQTFNPGNQSVWAIATNFSDPALCELFCELLVSDDGGKTYRYPRDGEQTSAPRPAGDETVSKGLTTRMAVVMRDRPFLSLHDLTPGAEENIGALHFDKIDASFAQISSFTLPSTSITQLQVSKDGRLRKNAFFAAPSLFQELVALAPELQVPLLHNESVGLHGLRRLDITSHYVGLTKDLQLDAFNMAIEYRQRIRDHYCLNHVLYNGTCSLAHGRPDIRVGSHLVIPDNPKLTTGAGRSSDGFHFYVESIAHTWNLAAGVKTNMQLTRGHRGNLSTYMHELRLERKEYNDIQAPLEVIRTRTKGLVRAVPGRLVASPNFPENEE